MTKKSKPRRKKTIKINLSKRQKIIVAAAAILLLAVLVAKIRAGFFEYAGLGEKAEIPVNSYQYASALMSDERGRLYYEDDRYMSLTGVDVSEYQKEIDWEKVKKDGVEFAMIRLGYRGYADGSLQLDARYEENIKAARKAGLEAGVYFVSQAVSTDEAIEEARYVLDNIRGKHVTCPVAFDMEPVAEEERIGELTAEERTAIADAFCQIIEKNGYTSMIYGNPSWLNHSIDLSYLADRNIWLAHYTGSTAYPYSHVMWQYTDRGNVEGIPGNADLNLWMVEKSKYPWL